MPSDFGERLASLRRSQGLSQEELAERLGLSRQAISAWERSQSAPDTANLVALARFYGLPLDQLLDEDHASGARGGEATWYGSPIRAAMALSATALLSWMYYAFFASPAMFSLADDATDLFGLTPSPALSLMLFLMESTAVAIPLLVLALVTGMARLRIRLIWLVPVASFLVFVAARPLGSTVFGLPLPEYSGIGAFERASVVLKADVLGLVIGVISVLFAQGRKSGLEP